MSWTASNPASLGEATKLSHYNALWDNVTYLRKTNGVGLDYAANDYTLDQNSVSVITSVAASAVVNTLYLKGGNTGLGVTNPTRKLQIQGADGNYATFVRGGATTGQSYGLQVQAGTNSSDSAFIVEALSGSPLFLKISGEGKISFGESSPDIDPGGLCLNHGDGDGFAITLKNDDVAHAGGGGVEADTYCTMGKISDTDGGLLMQGLTDNGSGIGVMITGKLPIGGDGVAVTIRGFENDDSVLSNNARILEIKALTTFITVYGSGGAVFGNPTGGDKSFGTINSKGVYDEGIELTCYPLEQYITGRIDTDFWDSVTPSKFHKNAREFKNKKQYLDLQTNIDFWLLHSHLPTMPSKKDWKHNSFSTGEMMNMLMETIDVQAVHLKEVNDRLKAVETVN